MAEVEKESEAGAIEAPPYDPILGLYIDLVELIEGGDGPTSITLCVGGMLVSGEIISADEYHEATGFARVLEKLRQHEDSEERMFLQARRFIHLKNARFFMGAHSGIPNNKGVLWRGRLSEVTGFNTGLLSAS